MRDYTKYKQCRNCGKYDIPEEDLFSRGYRTDYSMYCDGVLTWDSDPFAEEIHNDFSKSWDCRGSRYESQMDI